MNRGPKSSARGRNRLHGNLAVGSGYFALQGMLMASHPPDHCQVHPLPRAPQFVGWERELGKLRSWWHEGARGVIALVGLGGAGKTAITAHFLEELCQLERTLGPEGLFVWSFYQEPDVGHFLNEAYRYFAHEGGFPTPAKGAGLLHLLRDALLTGRRHLLVLDGLERVQQPESHQPRLFGQIEDPLLRRLLSRVAEGAGETVVLVTSRFPLTDLEPFLGQGYQYVDVDGLSLPAAADLLRRHGVQGDSATLEALASSYGAHALTLDHLGGLIGQFLGGDPRRAPELSQLDVPQQNRQALRLARLLETYGTYLPPTELALLDRLCLLRRSVDLTSISQLFLCSPAVGMRSIRELEGALQHMPAPANLGDDFPSELAASIRETIEEALQQAPIAGPDDAFRQSIYQLLEGLWKDHETTIEDDVEELSAQILMYLGSNARAWLATEPAQLYEMVGWEDDRARCQLLRADIASHMRDKYGVKESLDTATGWVLHSGSAEHLCLYHLVRSRIAGRAYSQEAWLAVEEGLHIARRCGFGLYLIELLCVQAELLLVFESSPAAAAGPSREAVQLASAAGCQFLWGAARAGQLLGSSLIALSRQSEARGTLETVRSVRERIGDPQLVETEALIRSIS
jgi:hypothetical protein